MGREGIRKAIRKIDKLMMVLCCAGTAAIAAITTMDGLGRYLFNRPIAPAYEITEMYLIVAVVFLSMGFVYKEGGHVDVDLVYARLPRSVRRFLDRFNAILIFILFVLIVVATWRVGVRMIRVGSVMSSINIPTGPAYFLVVIGSIFLLMRLVETIISGNPTNPEDEGGSKQ
jgi:TRAP-type transport system small permease protein